ncbi:DUF397 domain-containing protein [Actinomadura scrupuli]|uniref:DUF397 domain-containing protein n=1 Tax=Actinomadura scrupuli TaxID=559629 RepID=UPI003D99B17D
MTDFSVARWRKSSRSNDDYGNCVELAATPTTIGIRDSKNVPGPVLELTLPRLAALLTTIKSGDLDL